MKVEEASIDYLHQMATAEFEAAGDLDAVATMSNLYVDLRRQLLDIYEMLRHREGRLRE